MTPDKIVRKEEACAILQISASTLDRLARKKKIKRVILSARCIGYRVSELKAYLRRENKQ